MLPISTLVQIACLLEATARKPGNVHRFRDFEDASYVDFLLSAAAIGPALDRAAGQSVGRTILDAVQATRKVTSTNTNLGMVLLLAPLAAAREPTVAGVRQVLQALTVEDSKLAYEAIRLAGPAGLGKVSEQDVAGEPTLPLQEVMKLASERDLIARQYADGFQSVFDLGVRALEQGLASGMKAEQAIIHTDLTLMATHVDSLLVRKRGEEEAEDARRRAAVVLERGWPETELGRAAFDRLDAWLRAEGHARNPGTTADLVAASLFVALRQGTMQLPLDWHCTATR